MEKFTIPMSTLVSIPETEVPWTRLFYLFMYCIIFQNNTISVTFYFVLRDPCTVNSSLDLPHSLGALIPLSQKIRIILSFLPSRIPLVFCLCTSLLIGVIISLFIFKFIIWWNVYFLTVFILHSIMSHGHLYLLFSWWYMRITLTCDHVCKTFSSTVLNHFTSYTYIWDNRSLGWDFLVSRGFSGILLYILLLLVSTDTIVL